MFQKIMSEAIIFFENPEAWRRIRKIMSEAIIFFENPEANQ